MFSTRENAEFFNPYQSPDTLVRQQPVGRKVVQRRECQIVGRGHKNFYLPALRARVSDCLCAGAWFTCSPRTGRDKPRLVG